MNFRIKHEKVFGDFDVSYLIDDFDELEYVASSELHTDNVKCDIYYRKTPHLIYGNRYVGIFEVRRRNRANDIYVCNADIIEDMKFGMVFDIWEQAYKYSSTRNDYVLSLCDKAIDGGRGYIKTNNCPIKMFSVKDGKFIESDDNEINIETNNDE